jgi:flagellar protein FliS
MSNKKLAQYQAYSAASRTVPKTQQVVMLYDGVIRFLRQAKEAMLEKRIEDRFNLLLRASQIIVGLRSSIDYTVGGDVAHTLERFYTGIDVRILSLNFNKDGADLCDGIIEDLKSMRDVWDNIHQNYEGDAGSAPAAKPAAQTSAAVPHTASPTTSNVTLSA